MAANEVAFVPTALAWGTANGMRRGVTSLGRGDYVGVEAVGVRLGNLHFERVVV